MDALRVKGLDSDHFVFATIADASFFLLVSQPLLLRDTVEPVYFASLTSNVRMTFFSTCISFDAFPAWLNLTS